MASKGRPSSKFSFDVTKPIKIGFLNKQWKSGSRFKRRFFVVYPGFLVYYDEDTKWRLDYSKGDTLEVRECETPCCYIVKLFPLVFCARHNSCDIIYFNIIICIFCAMWKIPCWERFHAQHGILLHSASLASKNSLPLVTVLRMLLKYYSEGHMLYSEGHMLYSEGHVLYSEGHMLYSEGHMLYSEGHNYAMA